MQGKIPKRFHAVDVHNHILKRSQLKDMLKKTARLGIERFGSSCASDAPRVTPAEFRAMNDFTLEVMAVSDRIIGFCFVDPAFPDVAVAEIERCVDRGMAGVKLYHQHYICDEIQRPIMDCAARLGIPILMHAGKLCDPESQRRQPRISDASHFVRALEMFPKTTLIQGHIGGGGDWEWNLRVLYGIKSDHYFIDLSGSVCDAGLVRRTIRAVGVDRVLFSTDMSLEEGVGKVLFAGLSEAELMKIFSGNWHRIAAGKKV